MVLLFVLVIEYFQSRFATFTSVKDFSSTPTDLKLPDTFLGNSQERNLVLTEHEIKTAPFKGEIFCVWPWKVFYFETFWTLQGLLVSPRRWVSRTRPRCCCCRGWAVRLSAGPEGVCWGPPSRSGPPEYPVWFCPTSACRWCPLWPEETRQSVKQ